MNQEIKNEADKIFSEYNNEVAQITLERKNFLKEYRKRLEEEKIKELEHKF